MFRIIRARGEMVNPFIALPPFAPYSSYPGGYGVYDEARVLDLSRTVKVQDNIPGPHIILRNFHKVIVLQGGKNDFVRLLHGCTPAPKS